MDESAKAAVEVVLAYAAEKTLWENAIMALGLTDEEREKKHYAPLVNLDAGLYKGMSKEEIKACYGPMFQKYTTPKKRVYSGEGTSWGYPARFQGLTMERITNVEFPTKTRCEVTADMPMGFKRTYKFIVLKKGEAWLLDSVKAYRKSDGKWENSLL